MTSTAPTTAQTSPLPATPTTSNSQRPKGSSAPVSGEGWASKQGYVWREAALGDHVCVTPATRQRTWNDNSRAGARRDPNGPYGPNTCKQGFVWRNAFDGDAVCVTPQVREQTRVDNSLAAQRRVRG